MLLRSISDSLHRWSVNKFHCKNLNLRKFLKRLFAAKDKLDINPKKEQFFTKENFGLQKSLEISDDKEGRGGGKRKQ